MNDSQFDHLSGLIVDGLLTALAEQVDIDAFVQSFARAVGTGIVNAAVAEAKAELEAEGELPYSGTEETPPFRDLEEILSELFGK